MKRMRMTALLLCLCMALTLLPMTAQAATLPASAGLLTTANGGTGEYSGTGTASMENFQAMPRREYTAGQFKDVDENAWYGASKQQALKTAYELGIVSGKSNGIFDPNGPVQITEALKMAAVVHNIYIGGSGRFIQEPSQWWKVYVDYCTENGIITQGDFSGNYFRAASCAEMAYIFAGILPRTEMKDINSVDALPDVDDSTPYHEEILTMYRCGALQGSDKYGTFNPYNHITRAAVAAIIARIALPAQRLTFTLTPFAQTSTESLYEEGMWVKDIETLKALYTERLWGLYPDMLVYMDDKLVKEVQANPFIYNDWVPMAANVVTAYNENDDSLMVYRFNDYSLPFQMDAIMKDRSVVARASAKARSYLQRIDSILASLSLQGKSERQRLLAIHDWMVANISYDTNYATVSFQFYGPLDTGKAVCNGYAELFYYMATRAGTTCFTVTGDASSGPGAQDWGGHAWNLVQLAGDPTIYFIDVTYDDPVPDTKTGRHTYFMVTAEKLAQDHRW